MFHRFEKEIDKLLEAKVILPETADNIRKFYQDKVDNSPNKLFIVFGILGSILVGLGIILLFAHNWDALPARIKTVIAFVPMVAGQLLCGFVIIRKYESSAWRESSAAFLFCSVGACIALVSQIYNISGEPAMFIQTWMLLCIPIAYIMKSSMISLLYIADSTYYLFIANRYYFTSGTNYHFWLLILLVFPYYLSLYRNNPNGRFTVFHEWFLPVSLVAGFILAINFSETITPAALLAVLSIYMMTGALPFFRKNRKNNGFVLIGFLGTMILLFIFSFKLYWKDIAGGLFLNDLSIYSNEFIITVITTVAAIVLLIVKIRKHFFTDPAEYIFLLFLTIFFIDVFIFSPVISAVLINIMIFILGVYKVKDGIKKDSLRKLNCGLLILAGLIIFRFFDANVTFTIRGAIFILTGAGFIYANCRMARRRRQK